MTLSRHSSRIYMDTYDLQGTLNALDHRVEDCPEKALPFYMGAYLTLSIILNTDELRNQAIFMKAFENALSEINVLEDENAQN